MSYFYHFLSFLLCEDISEVLNSLLSNPTSFSWQSWVVQKLFLLFYPTVTQKLRESKFVHMSTSSEESSGELTMLRETRPKGKSSNLNKGRLEVGSSPLMCHSKHKRMKRLILLISALICELSKLSSIKIRLYNHLSPSCIILDWINVFTFLWFFYRMLMYHNFGTAQK